MKEKKSHLTAKTNGGGDWLTFDNFRGVLKFLKSQGFFDESYNFRVFFAYSLNNFFLTE